MANRLKELRKTNKLTLKELSKKINMPINTINQYENGKREPKLATWKKLADFFGVSVPYLQGFTVSKDRFAKWLNDSYLEALIGINASTYSPFYPLVEHVNEYLKLKHIKNPTEKFSSIDELIDCSDKVKDYWLKSFSFFFTDSHFRIVSETVLNDKYHGLRVFSFELNKKINSALQTPIRKKFNEICGKDFDSFSKNKDRILGLQSKREIQQKIKSLQNSLENFSNQLKDLPENKPLN